MPGRSSFSATDGAVQTSFSLDLRVGSCVGNPPCLTPCEVSGCFLPCSCSRLFLLFWFCPLHSPHAPSSPSREHYLQSAASVCVLNAGSFLAAAVPLFAAITLHFHCSYPHCVGPPLHACPHPAISRAPLHSSMLRGAFAPPEYVCVVVFDVLPSALRSLCV
eukprot:RCo013333